VAFLNNHQVGTREELSVVCFGF